MVATPGINGKESAATSKPASGLNFDWAKELARYKDFQASVAKIGKDKIGKDKNQASAANYGAYQKPARRRRKKKKSGFLSALGNIASYAAASYLSNKSNDGYSGTPPFVPFGSKSGFSFF